MDQTAHFCPPTSSHTSPLAGVARPVEQAEEGQHQEETVML